MTAPDLPELTPEAESSAPPVCAGAVVRRRSGERGQGMVEYAFILVLIAIAVVIAVQVLGSGTNSLYSNIENGVHIATGN